MSTQYFKANIKYDTNFGIDEERALYIKENNSIDYRYIVDENGDEPSMSGSDSYCNALSIVLRLGENRSNYDYSVSIEECSFKDLPDKVKRALDYEYAKQQDKNNETKNTTE